MAVPERGEISFGIDAEAIRRESLERNQRYWESINRRGLAGGLIAHAFMETKSAWKGYGQLRRSGLSRRMSFGYPRQIAIRFAKTLRSGWPTILRVLATGRM